MIPNAPHFFEQWPGVGGAMKARAPESGKAFGQMFLALMKDGEYHGITVDRAKRVLDALGVRLVTRVEVEPMHAPGEHPQGPVPEPAHRARAWQE